MALQTNNRLSFLLLLSLVYNVATATAWLGRPSSRRLPTLLVRSRRTASSSSSRTNEPLFLAAAPSPDADAAAAAAEELRRRRRRAARLRGEADSLERRQRAAADAERRALELERASAAAQRERHSAVIPILKPDGSTVEERCDFPPRMRDREDASFVTRCEAALPLGILLGESEELAGCTVVDEVAQGSNGEAAGLREGDIVRAITACQVTMETPTWQLMAGGIGVPKTTRFMYSVDGRPFEEVMDAVGSNRQDPQQRPMVIVIERRDES